MYKLIVIILGVFLGNACTPFIRMKELKNNPRQLLLVVADADTGFHGKLFLFEKKDKSWNLVKPAIPVCLGRNGLAWGMEERTAPKRMISSFKKEGDGRSPAGIFPVSTLFGFETDSRNTAWKMPYLQVNELTECIDDIHSFYYNQIVSRGEKDMEGNCDWKSCEKMWTLQKYYNLGAVVDYNHEPVRKGKGSCIFLHIWSGPDGPTAGCTSMSAEHMEEVARWMEASSKPTLVQLTPVWYKHFQKKWGLPLL